MEEKTKRFLILGIIILLAGLFFCGYSYLAFRQPADFTITPKLILNSPDETGNLFFARLFAEKSELRFFEPANAVAEKLVIPRSMLSVNGFTIPAGFIGLPVIYGSIAKIAGVGIIPYLTPLFALVGLYFLFLLLKDWLLLDSVASSIAVFLLAVFPGWWYYVARGMLPNVLFCSLLIISLYFFLKAIHNNHLWRYCLAGIFLGLALMTRTSEFFWILWLFGGLLFFYHKNIKWPHLLLMFFTTVLFFSPVFYFNYINYGQIFSLGYGLSDGGLASFENISSVGLLGKIIFPFGFHPVLALQNFFNYSFVLFSAFSAAVIVGIIFVLRIYRFQSPSFRKKWSGYLWLTLPISIYLIIYYGSWRFFDNPDSNAITIGTSYVRYFLPIYIFALPPLALLLDYGYRRLKWRKFLAIAIFILLVLSGYHSVMADGNESLIAVQKNLEVYQVQFAEFSKNLPEKTVIISGKADKVFFPNIPVIYQLKVPADYVRIKKLIENDWSVYQFMALSPLIDDTEPQASFIKNGLKLLPAVKTMGKFSLYPVANE